MSVAVRVLNPALVDRSSVLLQEILRLNKEIVREAWFCELDGSEEELALFGAGEELGRRYYNTLSIYAAELKAQGWSDDDIFEWVSSISVCRGTASVAVETGIGR